MREATINGKTLKLNEKNWHTLEERFNLKNAKPSSCAGDRYECIAIRKRCLCSQYPDCRGCPFEIEDYGCNGFGCLDVMDSILEEHDVLQLYTPCLEWDLKDDEKAREQIEKIHTFLMNMKKC